MPATNTKVGKAASRAWPSFILDSREREEPQ